MGDEHNRMTDQIQIAKELLRMLWRRKLLFLAVAIIGCAATLGYALRLTPLYEATAAIQIQKPQISGDLGTTADSSVAERVQQIEQRLMARANMISVIEELGLFADLPDLTLNDKVGVLREVTRIDRVAAPGTGFGANGTPSALIISVTLSDAKQAADTANRFVESVLELNEQKRSDLVRQTVRFFKDEETRISDRIVELEREIANFKNRNLDALPEGLSDRRDEIGQIESAELELETRILDLALIRTEGFALLIQI
ncbi:MAG: Wzz/FepE/Etk N-terminal domain-containing protein, partial [Pseudomonadota bacterium]